MPNRLAATVIGMAVTRWKAWLAGGTSDTLDPPGPVEAWYLRIAEALRRHPTAVDTALAAVVAACTVPQLAYWARQPDGGLGERLVFTLLLVTPLIWRRRFPLSTFAFAAAVALVQWRANVTLTADVALLVYLYTVASRYRLRVAAVAAGVVEVGVVMAALRWNLVGTLAQPWPQRILFLSGPVAAALLLGISVRTRRQSLAALTDRAEQLERERDQQAAIAAAAERTRIAREMHDVVTHNLSVMVTLSDAAALKVTVEPERAATAMRQVSTTGHQALDEMRRLLGVLRTEDDPQGRAPQPGLSQLDLLVDRVRATGLSVDLSVSGDRASVPLGAELTVYRIVQEAITNTLKHAIDPRAVGVVVAILPDVITVDVTDDGAPGRRLGVPGLGLPGMRERAAVYGGTVTAGPGPSGGWQVHARLPLASTASAGSGGSRSHT